MPFEDSRRRDDAVEAPANAVASRSAARTSTKKPVAAAKTTTPSSSPTRTQHTDQAAPLHGQPADVVSVPKTHNKPPPLALPVSKKESRVPGHDVEEGLEPPESDEFEPMFEGDFELDEAGDEAFFEKEEKEKGCLERYVCGLMCIGSLLFLSMIVWTIMTLYCIRHDGKHQECV
mmetsp:Transcript_25624/g.48539  ORF Transcript_25624/g.48539 Transcript_25624/m.48539 type:complete len:175 (+) Transcript_25624:423-947(+)|eukprot:CAMPEP_0114252428 /NCGR_PEP_ID=MMETSP0058-20121206/15831_1 /TAXON_ID=36894 /ORGANISM="Pyramimonas parkeae, CCMP726" /LENGTH=174 /DNA_ID=CAMNT_0001366361 /DNA_START=409 /DNA_END=933 /DNA_ORIENTATION=-